MPWIFTVTSRKGEPAASAPPESIEVWNETDLHRQIRLAAADPRDLLIEVQTFTPKEA